MSKETCRSCRHSKITKEWCEVMGCNVAKALKNEALLILGKKGNCPYHEHPEGWGWK